MRLQNSTGNFLPFVLMKHCTFISWGLRVVGARASVLLSKYFKEMIQNPLPLAWNNQCHYRLFGSFCLFLERTQGWQTEVVSVVAGDRGTLRSKQAECTLSTRFCTRDLGSSHRLAMLDFL